MSQKEIRPVGSIQSVKVDVRIVAATHKDLHKAVADGSFREDLYYRLAVFPVTLPPLRERKEDIPSLVSHFIDKYNNEFNQEIASITADAMGVLSKHHWPGNIRQLENVIYRAMIITVSGCIDTSSLPDDIKNVKGMQEKQVQPVSSRHMAEDSESILPFEESVKKTLQRALDLGNGNIPETAKKLNLTRSSFYRMVQKYGLKKPGSRK